jgi:hypothetical protein
MRDDLSIEEKSKVMASRGRSNLVSVTWQYRGNGYEICTSDPSFNGIPLSVNALPDASGLLCVEPKYDRRDNCYVLDACGKERYRLSVPWELTNYDVPTDAKMWFRSAGAHSEGKFGLTAWVEYAGDFYFELDYHNGRFLWGKEIRF